MNTLKEKIMPEIDSYKFREILSKYYNYFKEKEYTNIESLLSIDNIDNNDEMLFNGDIMEFFVWVTTEMNNVYSVEELKKSGQFHTSNLKVINLILDNIVDFGSKNVINQRFLEPSCGTGIFILTIIQRIYDNGYSKDEVVEFVNENIVGFDISEEMVYFTKLNIYLLLSSLYKDSSLVKELNLKIFVSDTTVKPDLRVEQLDFFNTELFFIETEEALKIKEKCISGEGQFDYVVGNPPYVTLYGRRDMKKTEELRNYYIDNYKFVPSNVKNGKFNLTMFFFEQALEWLKEKGHISFIVDISLFETAFKYLRHYLLENTKIKYLITDLSTFSGVGSGQVIISLQKNSNLEENLENKVTVLKYELSEKHSIQQKKWYEEEENKFSIIDDRSAAILKKIEVKSVPLVSVFEGKSLRTCTMMLDMEDQFTYKEKIETPHEIMPYYVGSKSLKNSFGNLTFEKYFEYNKPLQDKINDKLKIELEKQGIKNKKRIGLGSLEVYKSPKIFIRQSAKEIIATLSFETAAANNSLYCLSEAKNDDISVQKLKVTCAQLNSTILTFYALCKRIIRMSKGKQPQIKVSDLKQIRLTFDKSTTDKLLVITDQILSNMIETVVGIEKINHILFDYYGIDENEKAFILDYVKNY